MLSIIFYFILKSNRIMEIFYKKWCHKKYAKEYTKDRIYSLNRAGAWLQLRPAQHRHAGRRAAHGPCLRQGHRQPRPAGPLRAPAHAGHAAAVRGHEAHCHALHHRGGARQAATQCCAAPGSAPTPIAMNLIIQVRLIHTGTTILIALVKASALLLLSTPLS